MLHEFRGKRSSHSPTKASGRPGASEPTDPDEPRMIRTGPVFRTDHDRPGVVHYFLDVSNSLLHFVEELFGTSAP